MTAPDPRQSLLRPDAVAAFEAARGALVDDPILDSGERLLAISAAEVADWGPRSILDGVNLDAPPPTPALLRLVYPEKFHLLSGPPESAKSWLVCTLTDEALRAGWSVLVLDADGGGQRDLAARLEALGVPRELAASVGYSDDPSEWFGSEAARERLLYWIARQAGPVLVVVDTLNPTITGLGHKLDEAGVSAFEAQVIAPLKRAGAAIVGADHVAMNAPRDSPYSIGSQRKHAGADVHLRLTPSGPALTRSGPPATFVITGPKDRPGGIERRGKARHVGRVTFTPRPDGTVGYEVDLSPPSAGEARTIFRPTHLMERVSRWAGLQPGAFSKKGVTDSVTGRAEHLRHAVDVLLAEGYLEADGERYRHLRVYQQADDPEAQEGRDHPPGSSRGSSRRGEDDSRPPRSSPRPADGQADFGGSSTPPGRGGPASGGGGWSPSSPSLGGDVGRPPGGAGDDGLTEVVDEEEVERYKTLAEGDAS